MGYFGKVKFVDGIQSLGMNVISQLRRDADPRYLYTGPYRGRGRPRRYDGKVDLARRDRFTAVPLLMRTVSWKPPWSTPPACVAVSGWWS